MRRILAWTRQHLRFSISALVAFILALNLVVYMNWLAKEPYVSAVFGRQSPFHDYGEEYTRVTNYRIGWPVKFLDIRKYRPDAPNPNSPFPRRWHLISWTAAAETFGVSLVLLALYTWVIHKLLLLVAPPPGKTVRREARSQKKTQTALKS
jgi:hypothetical protein